MTPTQELVLDCYRSPHLLRSLADTAIPLPEGMDKVLRDATATEVTEARVDAKELREATLLYVKCVMLLDEADHYRILGVRFDAPAEQIDAHYRWLVALLQFDNSMTTRELSRRVGRVSRAHAVLSDMRRRHAYDKARYGALAGKDPDSPMELLVRSLREDRVRRERNAGSPMPMTGEFQSGVSSSKAEQVDESGAGHKGRRPSLDAGETHVFRGPSNGTLLAMSGAALLVILAVSPVIVSHYAAYFMPPDSIAESPTADRLPPSHLPAPAPAVADAGDGSPAALSFINQVQDTPEAPLVLFAGDDEAVFESTQSVDAADGQLLDTSEVADAITRSDTFDVFAEADDPSALDTFQSSTAADGVDSSVTPDMAVTSDVLNASDVFDVPNFASASDVARTNFVSQTLMGTGAPAFELSAADSQNKTIVAESAALERVSASPEERALSLSLNNVPAAKTPSLPPTDKIQSNDAEQSITAATTPSHTPAPAMVAPTAAEIATLNSKHGNSPPAEAATVPVKLIDSYDLAKLVERLTATYREGDTAAFMSLFAENARTNDQPDRVGITADYQALFQATERRSLQVADVQWKQMESGAVGEGRFVVRLKPRWKKREEVVSGKLTLEVKQQDQQLAITGLFHDYGALPRP